ncbi:ParB/Srx family N-terminal domain-containing protein [Paraburkholderia sp. PGU19]|uniref:ParB/Srx family N-terminal domain-containing protein n=1 Tax=Paraburkholderia sp. PGU19 TaxID=2735434 RepID=UPI0015DA0D92|nr:ParB/Srx family N-terminal domain-containing protein [Paraburkholderia sp. PGU19]
MEAERGPLLRVHWTLLRPTQGAIGYVHMQTKRARYLELPDNDRAPFFEEQAIRVVLGPAGLMHVVDHHHWARAWHDMGIPEAPVRITDDFSALDGDSFLRALSNRGWMHPFDEHGREIRVAELPCSLAELPDDVFQSLAACLRTAGVFENPGELNAKFAWADFLRQRIRLRPSTVEGFALMLAEAFAASRRRDARDLPGYLSSRNINTNGHDYAKLSVRFQWPLFERERLKI